MKQKSKQSEFRNSIASYIILIRMNYFFVCNLYSSDNWYVVKSILILLNLDIFLYTDMVVNW